MIYRVIGLMSGSSLDGLDIAFIEFEEKGGKWQFAIQETDCVPYKVELETRIKNSIHLTAREYVSLHSEYGHFLGQAVNKFIEANNLLYKVALIASHGHTTFHMPGSFSAQLGDGAAIAAETGLPVVSDLRAMDVALGGQGAPIVPVGEKLLFEGHAYFLNIGGIANISYHGNEIHRAFDICPANRILNMLSQQVEKNYDENGTMAAAGRIHGELLDQLNALSYYKGQYPKSLSNEFGTDIVYPLIKSFSISIPDALATYVEHIAIQTSEAIQLINKAENILSAENSIMVTGGGAFNEYLVSRISFHLAVHSINVVVPEKPIVEFKEAIIMALLGVLRWREEETVLSSITGASRNSIGGALWMGGN
jgi:anhydro-N-acetylmuramic acid kinase